MLNVGAERGVYGVSGTSEHQHAIALFGPVASLMIRATEYFSFDFFMWVSKLSRVMIGFFYFCSEYDCYWTVRPVLATRKNRPEF